MRRRLGREVLERVAQPLIGGIYASDPEALSLAATMPRFPEMERSHGSVILGSQRAQRRRAQAADETGARWSLFVSIDGGMEVLVRRIEEALGAGRGAPWRDGPGAVLEPGRWPLASGTPATPDWRQTPSSARCPRSQRRVP